MRLLCAERIESKPFSMVCAKDYECYDLNIFYCHIYTIGLNTSFTTYMKFSPVSYKHRSDREHDG